MNIENPKWMDDTKQCMSVTIDYQAVMKWAEVNGNVIADAD